MTEGDPETVVSASLQKIKSIKNPIKLLLFFFLFIKSETSDSFVNHFDGHFAYLKTLDFYFKVFCPPPPRPPRMSTVREFLLLNVHGGEKAY